MDRRAEILAEKLAAAKAAGRYEVVTKVIFVETEEEDEITHRRIKTRKMVISTPVFIFSVNFRRGIFRVQRWADKCPKASTPTMFYSWAKAASATIQKWTLHGEMGHPEFLSWLKTALGERAYQAYAELIA